MPCRYGVPVSDRIPVEMIEADFEMAFCLIDMAETEYIRRDPSSVAGALHAAGDVLADIETRLTRLPLEMRPLFDSLLDELRKEISSITQRQA